MAVVITSETTVNKSTKIPTITLTTGDYNAFTNPNGFGAPNPARSFYGILLAEEKYDEDGNIELIQITGFDSNVNEAISWTGSAITDDGMYVYTLLAFPYEANISSPSGSYSSGDYAITASSLYKYNGESFDSVDIDDFNPNEYYQSALKGPSYLLSLIDIEEEYLERYLRRSKRQCENKNEVNCIFASMNSAKFNAKDGDLYRAHLIAQELNTKYIN